MLAFILGDFLNSGSSFFNRSREYIGEVAGHKIHYTDYEAAKDQLTEVYKIESGRSDFDEDLTAQIRNQVWNMMLGDYSLRAQAKEIGMDVTPAELSDLTSLSASAVLLPTRTVTLAVRHLFVSIARYSALRRISTRSRRLPCSRHRPIGFTGRMQCVSPNCKTNTRTCFVACW